ncbi:TonB-dependent receptor [Sphingomonas bacterium]|uniref:TonB-dependent receptor n=1 Tax=Sphingomonas bacterium TaxID=1895847 RepID=UPI00262B9B72|nr:TonB-dependent receptor [Sphingomonas bacterium]MDB5678291.1 TonB-dependent receptor [Sphingomonas bacterium]
MTTVATRAAVRMALLAGAAWVLAPTGAHAQETTNPPPAADANGPAIDDIVITAQRREESLQKTPIAVTAISGEDLRAQNITSVADLARIAPSLSINASGSNAPTASVPLIYIRGIGQPDPAIYSDPGVPVYVDGTYVAKSAGGALDLPDIQRVEILRGPQGTLFGKNAVGGAVNVVTATPGKDPQVRVEFTGGTYNLLQARAYASVAASDTLGLSVAVNLKGQDGYGDRLAINGKRLGRLGDQDRLSGRVKLRWAPTNALTIDLAADYSAYTDTVTPGQTKIIQSNLLNLWNANVGGPQLGITISQANTASGRYDNFSQAYQPARDRIYGLSGTLTYDLGGGFSLKSISAYRNAHIYFLRDTDGSPATYIEISRNSRSRQYTQEVQLLGKLFDDKLNFIVGGFYLREDASEFNVATILPGLYRTLHVAGFDIGRRYISTQSTDSYALYAQGTLKITSRLSLTAGIRYTEDRKDVTVFVDSPESGIVYVPTTPLKGDYNAFTPRFSLDYQVTPNVLIYASASRGYKSGGFNQRPATAVSLTEFQPETLWSYEAGIKSDLFDHHIRANFAVYRANYSNIQLTRQILINNQIISDINNVAKARIQGFEGELTIVPVKGFELSGTVGYVDDKYTKLQPGAIVAPTGKIPYVPTWNVGVSARYKIDLGSGGTLTPSVNYAYRSSSFSTPINSAVSFMPSYGIIGARLAYAPRKGPWEVSVFGTNLADKRYITSIGDSQGIGIVYQLLGRPREFGATLAFHF